MRKIDFNENWYYRHLDVNEEEKKITLPHDAMCHEVRSMESRGRHNIGWFEGCDYVYRKTFDAPKEYNGYAIVLEFEGVYHNAEVYVNGEKAAYRPYGYTNFYVDISKLLNYGAENEIRVIAHNSDQPNSRWYTGSGIYRPVWMYIGKDDYVDINGVKIRTVDYDRNKDIAKLEIGIDAIGGADIDIAIEDTDGNKIYSQTVSAKAASAKDKKGTAYKYFQRVQLSHPMLWSVDTPQLYTCIVRCGEDEVQIGRAHV